MDGIQINNINKQEAKTLLEKYHYLTDVSAGFRISKFSYGAFDNGNLVAVCIFTNFPAAELFKSIWGINDFRSVDQSGFFELSRLCVHPERQKGDSFTSWFVAKSLRKLKMDHAKIKKRVKAVLSYADDEYHSGIIYAACNFKYYGLTEPKFNIWIPCNKDKGGKFLSAEKRQGRKETHWKQMTRGWTKHINDGGIKVMRGRKHRFLIVWDKKLPAVLWEEKKWVNNKLGKNINTHPKGSKNMKSYKQLQFTI